MLDATSRGLLLLLLFFFSFVVVVVVVVFNVLSLSSVFPSLFAINSLSFLGLCNSLLSLFVSLSLSLSHTHTHTQLN